MFKEFAKELAANLWGQRGIRGGPNMPTTEYVVVDGKEKPSYKQKIKNKFAPKNELKELAPFVKEDVFPSINKIPMPAEADMVTTPSVLPNKVEKKPFVEMIENGWIRAGRPAKNPYEKEFSEIFGVDAPRFEKIVRWGEPKPGDAYGTTFGGENLSFDGTAQNTNKNGTIDYGLIQANDETFYDIQRKYPDYMQAAGINRPEDLLDVRKNLLFTKLVDYTYGNRWYGASKDAPGSDREYWPNAPYVWGQRIGTQEFDFNQY